MPNLGPTELIIILVIVVLLFGASRLAGLGKSTGRAIREFKEETRVLGDKKNADPAPPSTTTGPTATPTVHPPAASADDVRTGEPRRDV